eukprot:UN10801
MGKSKQRKMLIKLVQYHEIKYNMGLFCFIFCSYPTDLII